MGNEFSKEEIVAFEKILTGFNDALVLSRLVDKWTPDETSLERAGDIIWRPVPYILPSYDGLDQSANFDDSTQLAVPASLGYKKSVPFQLTATNLRDLLQQNRLQDAAKQRLASDINMAVTNVASSQGTLVVKRTQPATGFDDVAAQETIMNQQGIIPMDRYCAWSSEDYNNAASNLAARGTLQGIPETAYEEAYVGRVASFYMYKMDYSNRLTAATGVGVTVNGAGQYYTPIATSTAATGETSNVDNRYQDLAITVTSGTVKVGDCFTIENVNAVHHITKEDTGQLKTFRVVGIVSGGGGTGTIKISPPIISNGGSTRAEQQYQNVDSTPVDTAVVTFLNTEDAYSNVFWKKEAIELMGGSYVLPDNAGLAIMKGTIDQGIQVTMTKQGDIGTYKVKYRFDINFGVTMLNPEMTGIILFNQT